MSQDTLTVALVTDVFASEDAATRLGERLAQAKALGAELAVLPELPLNPWSPATKVARDEDAEEPDGPRHRMMSAAAAESGIGVLGGVILRDPATGQRRSRALTFDGAGRLVGWYEKLHVPAQPGFWETSHYEPGTEPPRVVDTFGLRIGVQICSDINRPEGCHLLGARGAEAILAPRAAKQSTYERWRFVFQANALTSCAYVVSVNRPGPEQGVPIGGPSIVVDPHGTVILETAEPVAVCRLDRAVVREARGDYPGYLPVRSALYAEAWDAVARGAHREGAESQR